MSTGCPCSTYLRNFSSGCLRDPLIRFRASRNGFRRTFGDGACISRSTSMYPSRGRSPSYSARLSLEKMLRTVLNIRRPPFLIATDYQRPFQTQKSA